MPGAATFKSLRHPAVVLFPSPGNRVKHRTKLLDAPPPLPGASFAAGPTARPCSGTPRRGSTCPAQGRGSGPILQWFSDCARAELRRARAGVQMGSPRIPSHETTRILVSGRVRNSARPAVRRYRSSGSCDRWDAGATSVWRPQGLRHTARAARCYPPDPVSATGTLSSLRGNQRCRQARIQRPRVKSPSPLRRYRIVDRIVLTVVSPPSHPTPR